MASWLIADRATWARPTAAAPSVPVQASSAFSVLPGVGGTLQAVALDLAEVRGRVAQGRVVHSDLAEIDGVLFDRMRHEDVVVVRSLQPWAHAATPVRVLAAAQSFDAAAASRPPFPALRTVGWPLMLPKPSGPT